MTASEVLGSAISLAVDLGPAGAWVIPILSGLAGLGLSAVASYVVVQRLWWRGPQWRRALRAMPRGDAGDRVSVRGRLRARGRHTVKSFADGRPVALSVLTAWRGRAWWIVSTRTPGLAVEVEDGLVPVEGNVVVQRARALRPAADVEPEVRSHFEGHQLRVADVEEGELVVVEGRLARVSREALREPGAVWGVSSKTPHGVPVRMVTLRLDRRPLAALLAISGAALTMIAATPLPYGLPSGMARSPARTHVWHLSTLARLLAPTRDAMLDDLAHAPTPERGLAHRWALAAARERGVQDAPSAAAPADHVALGEPGGALPAR